MRQCLGAADGVEVTVRQVPGKIDHAEADVRDTLIPSQSSSGRNRST